MASCFNFGFCIASALAVECRRGVFGVALLIAGFGGDTAKSEVLSIAPVRQETHVWCWVAVGEMVFRHYGIPNVNPAGIYQCGIIGAIFHGTAYHACSINCTLCNVPAGSKDGLIAMLERYPMRVRTLASRRAPDVETDYDSEALSREDVVKEIDDGNPIVAGISPFGRPPGFVSQHVALIIGYRDDGNKLIVNDPYPFPAGVWSNPYIASGATQLRPLRYEIDYDAFKRRLNWRESVRVRRVANDDELPRGRDRDEDTREPRSLPNFCCTPAGKLGPYPNTSVPLGGTCYGTLYGRVFHGQACY